MIPSRAAWLCGAALWACAMGAQAQAYALAQPPAPAPPKTGHETHRGHGLSADAPLATDSVYQLHADLVDQTGRSFTLASHRGQPMLVSMFYSSCQFVCPMLIETIRHTQAQLSPAQVSRLAVLMVSIDPEHDTVTVLKQTAEQRQLDAKMWQLARTDAPTVRKIAAVLGVQYRALGNGDFNHTTTVLLLDGQGRIKGRTSQLGSADPEFVKLVKTILQAAAH
jgi:protein SCO1